MGRFTFEGKSIAAIENVDTTTLKSNSGAIGASGKLEYKPDFKLAGKPLTFSLLATERSALSGPANFHGVVTSAKIKPTPETSVTAKYNLETKLPALTFKIETTKVGGNMLQTEIGWVKGAPVAVEAEYNINELTKLQAETLGKEFYAMKATRSVGESQIKLKYIFPTQAAVIGLDTVIGWKKCDFEYNVKKECLDAKVKVFPMTFSARTQIGKSGVAKGGVTCKIQAERTWDF